jgi:Tol biopolymer transport system component
VRKGQLPQVSPDGRTIVFSRKVPSGLPFPYPEMVGGLFAIGVDGGGLRQLTGGGPEGASDVEPAFYPSGESVVFDRASGPTGEGDLHLVGLDDSGLRQLTQGPAREQGPTVSPSGQQIAFTCGPSGGNERIEDVCSIRPDGSHRRLLGYASPSYAPSGGSLIAAARGGSGPHPVRIRLRDPRHPQPLDPGGLASAPIWTARPKNPH